MKGTHLHSAAKRPGTGLRVDTQQQTGVQVNPSKEKPFLFARHNDVRDFADRRESAVGLGEIRVVVLELKEMREPIKKVPYSAVHAKSENGTTLHGVRYVPATSYS